MKKISSRAHCGGAVFASIEVARPGDERMTATAPTTIAPATCMPTNRVVQEDVQKAENRGMWNGCIVQRDLRRGAQFDIAADLRDAGCHADGGQRLAGATGNRMRAGFHYHAEQSGRLPSRTTGRSVAAASGRSRPFFRTTIALFRARSRSRPLCCRVR